jgi:ribosomal protein S18 acetylase RimI-like enzyme
LVIPDYLYNEALDNSLDTEGLSFTGNGVAMMTTELQKRQSPSSTLLDIKEMKNDLKAWSAPLIAFDAGSEVSNTYAERHRLASEAGVTLYHFSGFINNIAVCSLSLSINGGYARLDDISTLPAFQKKGYATELIDVVLKHLQALNINTCFLEASPEGLNLYKRMGFTELFVNRYYEQSNLS